MDSRTPQQLDRIGDALMIIGAILFSVGFWTSQVVVALGVLCLLPGIALFASAKLTAREEEIPNPPLGEAAAEFLEEENDSAHAIAVTAPLPDHQALLDSPVPADLGEGVLNADVHVPVESGDAPVHEDQRVVPATDKEHPLLGDDAPDPSDATDSPRL